MNVIRHDTPGKQSVFLIVEVIQGISHDIGDLWPAKMAGTRSIVKILLDDASRELLDFLCLVRAQISLKLDRRLDNAFAFGADSVEDRLGQRVGQPESYKVGRAFLFPVRQVPPPATSACETHPPPRRPWYPGPETRSHNRRSPAYLHQLG